MKISKKLSRAAKNAPARLRPLILSFNKQALFAGNLVGNNPT